MREYMKRLLCSTIYIKYTIKAFALFHCTSDMCDTNNAEHLHCCYTLSHPSVFKSLG